MIHLEIPDEIVQQLRFPPDRVEMELKRELALHLVRERICPLAQGGSLSGNGSIRIRTVSRESTCSAFRSPEPWVYLLKAKQEDLVPEVLPYLERLRQEVRFSFTDDLYRQLQELANES